MTISTVAVTGIVRDLDQAPIAGAEIIATLSTDLTDGTTLYSAAESVTTTTAGDGTWSLNVIPNDAALTPTGSSWSFAIRRNGRTLLDQHVIVATSDGPTVELMTLANLDSPPTVAELFVSAILAGSGISVDRATGQVTVSSDASGTVDSVVAGSSIHVDDTDPANPVVSVPANTFDAYGAAAAEATARAAAITSAINALIASAPGALDTLNELATALNDDPNFAATITTALAGKAGLTAANTFDNTQTFADTAGNQIAQVQNIGSGTGSNRSGAMSFSGGNGLGTNGLAFAMGIDTSATVKYRDFFMSKILSNGSVSDPDGIYISNGGTNPASIGIGQAQPGDSGRSVRLKVMSGANTQGGIQILQATTVTVYPLSITDTGGIDRFYVDPTVAAVWNFNLEGDTTTANPIITVRDSTTQANTTFQVLANGNATFKNNVAGGSACVLTVANTQQTTTIKVTATGEMQIGNAGGNAAMIQIGNHSSSWNALGFFGNAAVAQPSAAGTATGYAAGATSATFHSDDTYTGNTGTTGYTINGIVAALKNLGLIHS